MSCLPLINSTMCPSFQHYSAYLVTGLPVTDVPSFDTYIQTSIDTSLNQYSFGEMMRTAFNCPGWNGLGLRYHQSVFCGYLTALGAQFAPDNSPYDTCNPPESVIPLCQSTLDSFAASWRAVFADEAACPEGMNEGATAFFDWIVSVRDRLSADEGTCLVAESVETANCGFKSALEANEYCTHAARDAEGEEGKIDPCCASYITSLQESTETASSIARDNDKVSSNSKESHQILEASYQTPIERQLRSSSESKPPRFICVQVVGGGAFGLSSALSLQKRGYQVTVFDRLPIPAIDAASSDISKVIRPDYFTQPLYQHLALDALSIFKNQWNPDAKKRFGTDLYIESGSLLTFSDPTDPKDVNHQAEELKASGVETNMVGVENNIQDMMGESFAKTFHTGFSNPMSGYALASKTMKYLAEIAGEAGVVFVAGPKEGAFAEYLMEEDQVVGIITADGVKHYGDIVLMAAGSWTPSLVPQLEGLCVPSAHPVALIQLPVELQKKYSQIPI
ncbi:hypothetical protein HDU99_003454, partial [Rhizoclosmatium hyalinum]